MSRARTYTKSEIADAASAAAKYNVRVIMHPSGEIEFSPKSFLAVDREDAGEKAWSDWEKGSKPVSDRAITAQNAAKVRLAKYKKI